MELEEFIKNTINDNTLEKINDKVYLKKYQKEILDLYHIDYRNASSINEIIFLINELMDNDEIDDVDLLDEVCASLQEFNYYHNTNK